MKKTPVLLAVMIAACFASCKKNDTPPINKPEAVANNNYSKGDFVFSLSNLRKLTQARSVNGGEAQIIPSHLYVRFRPQTQEHINSIEEKSIPTYPFPLATDSLDTSNPDYSALYTFLPMSKLLPNCPYEILDTVMMLNPESPATAAAYAVAGKADRIPLLADVATVPRSPYIDLQPMPCDQWNDFSDNQSIDYEVADCFDCPCDYGGGGYTPPPPPPPPAPIRPADPRATPVTVSYNSCSMNTDVNYASGRILVEETQWGNGSVVFEGVSDVKVEILGPNGQRVIAQTNRYGCFKATGAIRGFRLFGKSRLPVVQNVIFESGRKEIRGYNDAANLSQYTQPLKHIYANIADRMNNANIYYRRNTNDQDNDCKYYVAATVNNALYDFDEYASKDGILPPPNNLKILVHRFAGAGAAPMFANMSSTHPIETATMKSFFIATASIGAGLAFGDPVTIAAVATQMAAYAPDIIIGYGWNNDNSFHTDQIKELAYHEFSHASHYRKTDYQLWTANIKFVVNHGGYGNAGDNGVERTDLIEMWGYFMGREYAHRRYGPDRHSLSTPVNFQTSWYAYNENRYWPNDNASIFESGNHIAAGFLHDICDDNNYNTPRSLDEHLLITSDDISGYKIATIYNALDGSTTSANELINKLSNQLPTGQTIANFNTLRNLYGY